MILIVCPNLAIDVTVEVNEMRIGDVHRARRLTRRAGGKGVNVARAATALGGRTVVLGFAGGRRGAEIAERLDDEGLAAELVTIDSESRTCTIALEPNGRATVLNETGPTIDDASELSERFHRLLPDARAVVLAGSLQPGLAPTLYRDFVAAASRENKICVVDASGSTLREALTAGPSVVKPNHAEAETFLGEPVQTRAACVHAALELRAAGAALAIVSRGADGVVAASVDGVVRVWCEPAPSIRLGNPTGAGDALAAGIVVGRLRGFDVAESLRLGVAAATASLAEGYGRFRARDVRIETVRIETLD